MGHRRANVPATRSYADRQASEARTAAVEDSAAALAGVTSGATPLSGLLLAVQDGDPAAPDAGRIIVYAKADGIYFRDAAGTVSHLATTE